MNKKILGVDPGTAILGWGYVEVDESGEIVNTKTEWGAIKTEASSEMPDRLLALSEAYGELLDKYNPRVVGVEGLFFNKNVKTAMTVAQARGVVLAVSRAKGVWVVEPTPTQVKEAVTGYGKADKSQVQTMVKTLLGLDDIPRPDDAADGLAVALYAERIAVDFALAEGDS